MHIKTLRAYVRNGRLIVDEPLDLYEGEVSITVTPVPGEVAPKEEDDDEDWAYPPEFGVAPEYMSPEERAAFDASLDEGLNAPREELIPWEVVRAEVFGR